jgi:hypothetical protein
VPDRVFCTAPSAERDAEIVSIAVSSAVMAAVALPVDPMSRVLIESAVAVDDVNDTVRVSVPPVVPAPICKEIEGVEPSSNEMPLKDVELEIWLT